MVQALLFTPDLIANMLVPMETNSEFGKGAHLHKMTTHQESILVFGYGLASRCCALNLFLMNIEMILGI